MVLVHAASSGCKDSDHPLSVRSWTWYPPEEFTLRDAGILQGAEQAPGDPALTPTHISVLAPAPSAGAALGFLQFLPGRPPHQKAAMGTCPLSPPMTKVSTLVAELISPWPKASVFLSSATCGNSRSEGCRSLLFSSGDTCSMWPYLLK